MESGVSRVCGRGYYVVGCKSYKESVCIFPGVWLRQQLVIWMQAKMGVMPHSCLHAIWAPLMNGLSCHMCLAQVFCKVAASGDNSASLAWRLQFDGT